MDHFLVFPKQARKKGASRACIIVGTRRAPADDTFPKVRTFATLSRTHRLFLRRASAKFSRRRSGFSRGSR